MNALWIPALAGTLAIAGESLTTDYSRAAALRIETETEMAMQTTDFSMEVDGEPVDNPRFGGGGGGTSETRRVVQVDRYVERADGQPTQLRRTFEAVESSMTISMRDEDREVERECPLDEVTLDLTLDDGDVVAEVVEGSEPDDDALLEGHRLELALDALLPDGDVDVGDDWEIEGEALLRALGIDLEAQLFPAPPRPEGGGGQGRGGRGGGRRGGFGGGRGGGMARLFQQGDWQAEATIASLSVDHDGVVCAQIDLELECDGELEDQMPERRRDDFATGIAVELTPLRETSFEIELEGRLLYSITDRRPLLLELEGEIRSERNIERDRGDRGVMTMSTTQEGTFKHTVSISEGESL